MIYVKVLVLNKKLLSGNNIIFIQVESHRKAAAATAAGKFKDEIIPIDTKVKKINVF